MHTTTVVTIADVVVAQPCRATWQKPLVAHLNSKQRQIKLVFLLVSVSILPLRTVSNRCFQPGAHSHVCSVQH